MGSQISALYYTVKSVIQDYTPISDRLSSSPGIPVLNSSIPYWTAPNSPIAQHGADRELPKEVDVVIVGSGITGVSLAKTILESSKLPIRLAILEARDACSGASGRNGGHIGPNTYNEYPELKSRHGRDAALEILRFRWAHIKTLLDVASQENVVESSQARLLVDYDVFFSHEHFEEAKSQLEEFRNEVPEDIHETFRVVDQKRHTEELQLNPSVLGCIQQQGAAMHVYRFVTGLLSNLLGRYHNFQLFTRTPCTDILSTDCGYVVRTPRGDVRTLHVIHATNAWSSHLLPGMRKRITPFRAHMSAQRPGQGLPVEGSSRGFVFYSSDHPFDYDYLTQLVPKSTCGPDSLPTDGEMMYGGGSLLGGVSEGMLLQNLGISDDSNTQLQVELYLADSLERHFSRQPGTEHPENEEGAESSQWGKGRIKSVWSGIIGISADMLPWVGRVPKLASGRNEPPPFSESSPCLAAPGEWISAGFTGEGMVHAWLCGQAVARMVLSNGYSDPSAIHQGSAPDGDVPLPNCFLITERRLRKAKLEDLMLKAR